ncbi:type IV secretion system DNA-binding domain-containing protein [Candidatus Microgenomates bacterium]|nr:type IV secretion system DNA-binding domain-containing protein [Candidatus Microgenomates bacterium]
MDYTLFEIKVPRGGEETPEHAAMVFSSLASQRPSFWKLLTGNLHPFFLEIASFDQSIHFFTSVPTELASYFESQMSAQYPRATIERAQEYLTLWRGETAARQLTLSNYSYYPLKTWKEAGENVDPLSAVLGVMAKSEAHEKLVVQFVVIPARGDWTRSGRQFLVTGIPTAQGSTQPHPKAALVERKLGATQAFIVGVRLLSVGESLDQAKRLLDNLAGSFGAFSIGESNSLIPDKPLFFNAKKFTEAIVTRAPHPLPRSQVLTVDELATLWHLPQEVLGSIPTISWGGKLAGEAPEDLPVVATRQALQAGLPVATRQEGEKSLPAGPTADGQVRQDINFFARTEFKGKPTVFGIKRVDRRRHIYLIGKTGSGKSTLIANMAINDMRNGEGVAVIDPHGDLSEILLNYVPSFRINDVVYLDAADRDHPFRLNLFEATDVVQHDLIASGVVAIFYKLYYYTWGPRLEYVFRNAILTLIEYPNATLVDVPRLLTDREFRQKVVEKLDDPVLINFWNKEYEGMGEKLQSETISPILNKVGQFVSSPLIRNIIGYPHSTIDLGKIMNEGKILILNLAQGKLGEDNSALLGAMVVTKLQLAAMERVRIPETERRDFFLYVDEFQNFATASFIKILSEARKYRLSLILANQYIAQVPEEVQKAILGNVGSLVSFVISAQDAAILAREFAGTYKEEDLVGLDNYQTIVKMTIDGKTSRPFTALTLPLPRSRNQNRTKVIKSSQERYTKEVQPFGSAQSKSAKLKVKSEREQPENTPPASGTVYEAEK